MPSPDEIDKLARNVRRLWARMCREAGIPEDSSFVNIEVFKGNKYLPIYDKALADLQEARRRYASGYTGQKIDRS